MSCYVFANRLASRISMFDSWLTMSFAIITLMSSTCMFAGNLPCTSTALATNMTAFNLYDNSANTDSGFEAPPYGGYADNDIWFSFVAPNGNLFLILEGLGLVNPAVAVYQGPCDNLTLIYNVLDNNCNGEVSPNIEFTDLTPGESYFIRIWPEDGGGNGDFNLRLTQDISPIIEFSTFGDAQIIGDCIQLTADLNTQSGCAWFQNQIDFTQPFTHVMSANFGNNDGGADGICLIYQSNGPDICGTGGGGIGALNMPNSAIFEFDTYQNTTPYNDPIQDHTSFNINGDMNHNNNIEGPVQLGNIEDGQNHEISFTWNPAGNLYEVSFDGTVVLSGSFDIVANCFGGNPLTYWGYTSATGGASNEQIICPELIRYEVGTQSYEEITICEGQDYNGQTNAGFFYDLEPEIDGCMHQNNYLINVIINDIIYLNEVICFGEVIDIDGQIFDSPGSYLDIETTDAQGCLQLYDLNLEVIAFDIISITNDTLTCIDPLVQIGVDATIPIGMLQYNWFTSDGNIVSNATQANIEVDQSGTYELLLSALFNGEFCDTTLYIIVEELISIPVANAGSDGFLDCTNAEYTLDGSGSSVGAEYMYVWRDATGTILSNTINFSVNTAGNYSLTVVNNSSGCIGSDTVSVQQSIDLPIADAGTDGFLNCTNSEYTLDGSGSSVGAEYMYVWRDATGTILSNTINFSVNTAGNYSLTVVNNSSGCIGSDTVSVQQSIDLPIADAGTDGFINCTNAEYTLDGSGSSVGAEYMYVWRDATGTILSNTINFSVNTAGNYSLTVVNNSSGCIGSDTVSVQQSIDLPIADAGTDGFLNCTNSEYTLDGSGSSVGAEYMYVWRDATGSIVSNTINFSVNTAGSYSLTVVNNTTGCMSSDTTLVTASTDIPQIFAGIDTILDCGVTSYLIHPIITNSDPNFLIFWTTSNGNILSTSNIIDATVNRSGLYILTASNPINNCMSSDTVQVIFTPELASVTFDIPDTLNCFDLAVPINAHYPGDPGLIDFTWSSDGGDFTVLTDSSIQTLNSGFYILTISDPVHNCTTTDSIFVFSNKDAPYANAGIDDIIHCDDTLMLDGNLSSMGPSFIYLWTTTNGHIIQGSQSRTPRIDQAGDYLLTVSDITNGCTSMDTVTITFNQTLPEIMIAIPNIITCSEPIITLYGSSPNNLQPITYSWSTSDGSILGPTHLDSILVDQPGTYTLSITNADTRCINSLAIMVTQDLQYPTIDAGPDMTLSCDQSSVQLLGNLIENLSAQINWTHTAGNIVSGAQSLTPIVNRPAVYHVTASFENGCLSKDSVEVFIDQDVPLAIIREPTLLNCLNEDQILDASGSSQGGTFLASWSQSSGSIIDASDIYRPLINSAGTYILEIKNTANNCTSYDTVMVLQDITSPIPDILYNDINCIDTISILDASGSSGAHALLYVWSGEGVNPDDVNASTFSTSQTGTYYLELIDIVNGCSSTTSIVIESDYSVDDFDISLPPLYETNLGQEIHLNASINFDSNLISHILWVDAATLKNSISLHPVACPIVDTDYQLTLTINNICELSAQTRVRLTTSDIYIPNIFTPNGDGTNDGFTIYGAEDIQQIDDMIIVNRWGDIVYKNQNFLPNNPNLGWDGTFRGEYQLNGVYIYYVQIRYIDDSVRLFNGDVTVIK